MDLKNISWKDMFSKEILEDAREFSCEGYVGAIFESENTISASVYDTKTYSVKVESNGKSITDISCTCPDAEGNRTCRHIAAVLFKHEYLNGDTGDKDGEINKKEKAAPAKGKDSIEDIVNSASEKVVRTFLIKVLKSEQAYELSFRNLINPKISDEHMRSYKSRIDSIISNYKGREYDSGYSYHYYYEPESTKEYDQLEDLLSKDIRRMIDKKFYMKAFELTTYMYLQLEKIYDEDPELDESEAIAGDVCSCWEDIIDLADEKQQDTMLMWFIDQVYDNTVPDEFMGNIKRIIMEKFHTPDQLRKKLAFTEDMQVYEEPKEGTGWGASHEGEYWALNHLSLLDESGADKEEVEAYAKCKWKYRRIKEFVTEKAIESEDYPKAEAALKENIELSRSGWSGLSYKEQLRDLYKKQGKTEEYRLIMWEIVLKDYPGKMEYYRELKSLYDEDEWKALRNSIPAEASWRRFLDEYYYEEHLYRELMDSVKKQGSIDVMLKYSSSLTSKFPEEVLDIYQKYINRVSGITAGREVYRKWASILQKMKQIDGGKEIVRKIVSDWRKNYKRKRALIDEISDL